MLMNYKKKIIQLKVRKKWRFHCTHISQKKSGGARTPFTFWQSPFLKEHFLKFLLDHKFDEGVRGVRSILRSHVA